MIEPYMKCNSCGTIYHSDMITECKECDGELIELERGADE